MIDRLELRDSYLGHEGKVLVPSHLAGLRRVEAYTLPHIEAKVQELHAIAQTPTKDLTPEQYDVLSDELWTRLYGSIKNPDDFLNAVAQLSEQATTAALKESTGPAYRADGTPSAVTIDHKFNVKPTESEATHD